MSNQDSYDRILNKIDGIQTRLEQIEHKLLCMLKDADNIIAKSNKELKARDVPLGTKVYMPDHGLDVEIIAYSKQGDQVVVLEDEDGDIYTKNINSLRIIR